MHTWPLALEGETPTGAGALEAAQREQRTAGAAEEQDPGPGSVAGELRLPGHLDALQCQHQQSLHTGPPEDGPKAGEPPSSPGLPRSEAAFPSEGSVGSQAAAGWRVAGRGCLGLGCARHQVHTPGLVLRGLESSWEVPVS